jgi:hypothetical protein
VFTRAPVITPAEAKKNPQPIPMPSQHFQPSTNASVAATRNVFLQKEQQKTAEIAQRSQEITTAPGFKEVWLCI